MLRDVLICEIRGRRCALPTESVREVVSAPALTPVPLAPPVIKGVLPIRGQIVPLLDLGVYLGPTVEGSPQRSEGDRVVMIQVSLPDSGSVAYAALAVDSVTWVATIDDAHTRPAPVGIPMGLVSAVILDAGGPAFLIDPDRAVALVRDAVQHAVAA